MCRLQLSEGSQLWICWGKELSGGIDPRYLNVGNLLFQVSIPYEICNDPWPVRCIKNLSREVQICLFALAFDVPGGSSGVALKSYSSNDDVQAESEGFVLEDRSKLIVEAACERMMSHSFPVK